MAGRLAGRRLLVVDDDEALREALTRLLAAEGAEVEQASDGREALQIVAEADGFDVVLMDLHMPALGGVEAARRIRAAWGFGEVPSIVGLTGGPLPADGDQAVFDVLLQKPVDFGIVMRALEATLGSRILRDRA